MEIMFITSILRRYRRRENRITLIREIIDRLALDDRQKQLYRDALTIIDDEALEAFYERLTGVVAQIEDEQSVVIQEHRVDMVRRARENEQSLRIAQTDDEFNILLSNI